MLPAQYELAAHSTQFPWALLAFPGLQMHWLADVAPVPAVLLLGVHCIGAETDDGQYDARGHGVGLDDPAAQYEPTGHGLEIPLTQKFPLAHVVGAEDDARQNEPCGHAIGAGEESGQNDPTGHGNMLPSWQ